MFHTHTHTHIYMYVCTCVLVDVYVSYTHVPIYRCIYVCIIHMHTYMHTYMHTHLHTYTHRHAYHESLTCIVTKLLIRPSYGELLTDWFSNIFQKKHIQASSKAPANKGAKTAGEGWKNAGEVWKNAGTSSQVAADTQPEWGKGGKRCWYMACVLYGRMYATYVCLYVPTMKREQACQFMVWIMRYALMYVLIFVHSKYFNTPIFDY